MKRKNHIRGVFADTVFLALDWILLLLFLVMLLYPLLFVVSASFSGGAVTMSLSLIPKVFSLAGYRAVFNYAAIWTGYLNSLIYMVLGTVISLVVTVCCAYPLSRPDFKFGGVMMLLCVITMYFSGGLIPGYLNIRNLHMLDTVWAIVIPGSLSVYNMIVVRTFFKTSIPGELREAAQLDGCGDLRYLTQILLPLSVPVLAVIALYCAVGQWNSYFGPMIYLQSRTKYPLALILRDILVINNVDPSQSGLDAEQMISLQKRKETMKYAVIMVSSVPMLILYPFIQRYFVKGVMIGAVKG